jgi:hypothetical protein
MTKSEMEYLDSVLLGPLMLFLNQYFKSFLPEYFVLWLCVVSLQILRVESICFNFIPPDLVNI